MLESDKSANPFPLSCDSLSAAGEWPLRVHTLGRFSVLCDGQVLLFNGKSPRKALELLQVLIAYGGREVHTSVLIRDLWKEETAGDTRNLFDNTLHRLRRLLGPNEVLDLHNGKLTLKPEHCWIDTWAFGRLSSGFIDRASKLSDAEEERAFGEAKTALQLYNGHFLQYETEDSWACRYRDRLQSQFHRLVLAMGACLEHAGRWEMATDVYLRGLEVDNLAEFFYQRLMACYQSRGEHAEVMRVYRRCRELLSIVLGISPSAETERIRLMSATYRSS